MLGKLITGRYLVLQQLRSGGFGQTYLVQDRYLPHHPLFVLKCLNLTHFDTHSMSCSLDVARQLFLKEAQILHELDHDQIPQLFACIEDEMHLCLVIEFMEGELLEVLMGQRCFQPQEVITFLSDALPLLQSIHARGIVHLDIKPSNLIGRKRDRKLVLIDFGAALRLSERQQVPVILGTPGYSPQEQLNHEPSYSSDFYALGMTAIQLLTGVHPQALSRDPVSQKVQWQEYLHLPTHSSLLAILDKLTAVEERQRYFCTADVLADLDRLKLKENPAVPPSVLLSSLNLSSSRRGAIAGVLRISVPGGVIGSLAAVGLTLTGELPSVSLPQGDRVGEHFINLVPPLAKAQPIVSLSLQHDIYLNQPTQQIRITPDQKLLLQSNNQQVYLWDLQQGKRTHAIERTSAKSAWMASQNFLIEQDRRNQRLVLWNRSSGLLHETPWDDRTPIAHAAIDGDRLATLTQHQGSFLLKLWDLSTQQLKQAIDATPFIKDSAVTHLYHTANHLVGSTTNHQLLLWGLQRQQPQLLVGHTDRVLHLQADPQTGVLYSFGEDRAIEWDLEKGELIRAFPSQAAGVKAAGIHSQFLLTLHTDGSVQVWHRGTRQLLQKLVTLKGLSAVSSEGQYLVNVNGDRLRIWRIEFQGG